MDLGQSSAIVETDEMSHSSLDERTRSASPPIASQDHIKAKKEISQFDQEPSSFRGVKSLTDGKSPESESLSPNKIQKLNTVKPIDESSGATMRKARVSVRARSEAPMVC